MPNSPWPSTEKVPVGSRPRLYKETNALSWSLTRDHELHKNIKWKICSEAKGLHFKPKQAPHTPLVNRDNNLGCAASWGGVKKVRMERHLQKMKPYREKGLLIYPQKGSWGSKGCSGFRVCCYVCLYIVTIFIFYSPILQGGTHLPPLFWPSQIDCSCLVNCSILKAESNAWHIAEAHWIAREWRKAGAPWAKGSVFLCPANG